LHVQPPPRAQPPMASASLAARHSAGMACRSRTSVVLAV
jgi:hypothetical protein